LYTLRNPGELTSRFLGFWYHRQLEQVDASSPTYSWTSYHAFFP
jgi:hypothetical protein